MEEQQQEQQSVVSEQQLLLLPLNEATHIKCEKCGYEWKTRSNRKFTTCPSCFNTRVKNNRVK